MANLEYEHSFNVKSIEPFIDYCKKNGYEKVSKTTQNRVVFENKNNSKIIARLTTEIFDDNEFTVIDFKNLSEKKDDLNISTESLPMEVNSNNKESILSILKTLEFFEVANNLRVRYVFIKGNVKFEIDDYIRPQMKVVAVEGEREEVELVYENIKNLLN